jgi:hypothetical protein
MSLDCEYDQDLRMVFDNGWGVSIQRSEYHRSTDTSYEVAVLHQVTNEKRATVCSRQWIAPDGIDSYMSPDMVAVFIHQVQALKYVEYCTHKMREPCQNPHHGPAITAGVTCHDCIEREPT